MLYTERGAGFLPAPLSFCFCTKAVSHLPGCGNRPRRRWIFPPTAWTKSAKTLCLCGFPALSYYNAFVNPPNNSCGFHTIPPVAVSRRKLSGGLFFHRIVFARFDGIIRKECPRLEEMCFFAARQLDSAWLFRQSIRIWKLHPALARSLRERRGLLYGETHPQASSFSKPASP